MDDQQPSQAFITALVTEHFVLQSARATTVSEAVGRSAVYLASVSGALVAFGFLAQTGHRLAVVGLVLPALVILGVFTFVRLVETSVGRRPDLVVEHGQLTLAPHRTGPRYAHHPSAAHTDSVDRRPNPGQWAQGRVRSTAIGWCGSRA